MGGFPSMPPALISSILNNLLKNASPTINFNLKRDKVKRLGNIHKFFIKIKWLAALDILAF